MKKIVFCLSTLLVLIMLSCNTKSFIEESPESYTPQLIEGGALKDAAAFPIGNIWSAGHPTWGDSKGTDLGGPNNIWSPDAFGILSTIVQKQLELPLEDELIAEQFNSITPEVALKPHCISVSPDSIDFREADAMMDFAETNQLRVHGHVLLFDKSVPEWALDYEADGTWTESQWESWLEDYITEVVGRYRGRIAAWDVVNEIGLPLGGGLNTDYFWHKVIGPDYIEKAFRWAEAADPDVKLFINEFAIGFFPDKLNDIIDIADELRALGCRVDGIGFQGHLPLPVIMGDYDLSKRAYKKAADAGYLVHLSELDIAVNAVGLTQEQSDLQHRIQRKKYNDISRAYLDGVPEDKQWGITLWGIPDRNSFYNTVKIWFDLRLFGGEYDYPLLWDRDYNIKPAYYGFRNGLGGIYEGWLFPELFEEGRNNGSLPTEESAEMELHVLYSVDILIAEYGYSKDDATKLVAEMVERLKQEGVDW